MAVPFDACSVIAIMGLVLCLQPKGVWIAGKKKELGSLAWRGCR